MGWSDSIYMRYRIINLFYYCIIWRIYSMIKPKNLDMEKIERLFNEHFTFDKEDLNKGLTCWTITPKREDIKPNENNNTKW